MADGDDILFWPSLHLYIGNAGKKGRGVFAGQDIVKGEVIEVAPVLLGKLSKSETTPFDHVMYEWGKGKYALALGYGSLYNHSLNPNAAYELRKTNGQPSLLVQAIEDIELGDEITVNYNGDPRDQTPWEF